MNDLPDASTEPPRGASVPDPQTSPPTGVATDISAQLAGLADRPVEEHPEVYEEIHRRLGNTLSGIDHV
ncbi:MAG: hypothetical protein M3492_12785 [Actinomycetota bacterium]|nr:hypothetical protein [Actinomycetota bacterium]